MSRASLNHNLFTDSPDLRATRDGFGEGLVLAGQLDPRVVALVADLAESTRMEAFKQAFPERFVEVGVAEQNLVTVASGLAAAGKVPFAASYATFSPGRNWEQIRTTICYNNQPVIIVGSHAGVSVGPDGATHQALEDIALMRVLPNMIVVSPCDAIEARKATVALAKCGMPAYLRLGRSKTPIITAESTSFTIGTIQKMTTGKDVTVLATGSLLYQALVTARNLHSKQLSVEVLNVATIKPLDVQAIVQSVKKTKAVVTVEEHQVAGGLGGAVAELLAAELPTPIEFVGLDDQFGESGSPDELVAHFGLDATAIAAAIRRVIRRK